MIGEASRGEGLPTSNPVREGTVPVAPILLFTGAKTSGRIHEHSREAFMTSYGELEVAIYDTRLRT